LAIGNAVGTLNGASATGGGSIALGSSNGLVAGAVSNGAGAIAIGSGASATGPNSVAIGKGVTATAGQAVIKGGTNSGILTLQDGDAGAGTTAGSTITISGSGGGAPQTAFQTTTDATTTQVTTMVGTADPLVASTAVLQAGPNAVVVDSVAGTTVTGALAVSGAITTNGIGNTGLLANTGNLTNTGNVTIGGNTSIGGNLAVTGKQITLGAADGTSTVTIPGIASRSGGQRFVATDDAGNLSASQYTINDYNSALKQVDQQVSQVGAIAAALTAIPNLTSGTSTYGCGIGTGGFGSSWAGAAGCVAKVSDNIWVNGALSYSPSVSTPFGSTPSVAGRLGVFFQF
jgi:hypothetical protein